MIPVIVVALWLCSSLLALQVYSRHGSVWHLGRLLLRVAEHGYYGIFKASV